MILTAIWTRIQGWLAVAGAILAAIGAAWLAGRRSATQAVAVRQAEQRAAQAQERVDVENEVARVPDPAAELRRDWSR